MKLLSFFLPHPKILTIFWPKTENTPFFYFFFYLTKNFDKFWPDPKIWPNFDFFDKQKKTVGETGARWYTGKDGFFKLGA